MNLCKLCQLPVTLLQCKQAYYHCSNCQLIYAGADSLLSPDYERSRYLLHNNHAENQGYVQMLTEFADYISPWAMGAKGLDFGCGPGPVLAELLEARGWQVDTYDPFFAPAPVFRGQQYDLITVTEVAEHFFNPLEEWQLLAKHLAAEGLLAVRTSFHPGPEQFCSWWYIRDETHVVFYNQVTFQWLADSLGLRIIDSNLKNIVVFVKPEADS